MQVAKDGSHHGLINFGNTNVNNTWRIDMENTAQCGIIKFEQLCEKLLEKQEILENAKIWFQVNILDAAQNIFERQRSNSKGA